MGWGRGLAGGGEDGLGEAVWLSPRGRVSVSSDPSLAWANDAGGRGGGGRAWGVSRFFCASWGMWHRGRTSGHVWPCSGGLCLRSDSARLVWGLSPPGLSGQPREQKGEAGRVSSARQQVVGTSGHEGLAGTEVAGASPSLRRPSAGMAGVRVWPWRGPVGPVSLQTCTCPARLPL